MNDAILTVLALAIPAGMITWGLTMFVVRLRRQRRRNALLASDRVDLNAVTALAQQPQQPVRPRPPGP